MYEQFLEQYVDNLYKNSNMGLKGEQYGMVPQKCT